MHELGVLYQAVKAVDSIAKSRHIQRIKHITLEVGEQSGYVPYFLKKLFPVAVDSFPAVIGAELRILMTAGRGLIIKDIGY